jgi:hypothetical protein
MNYPIVEQPPENIADYVTAPEKNNDEAYINNLAGLLREANLLIKTDPVEIRLVDEAIKRAKADRYIVTMQRVPVNFGEPGTAFGIFYFELKPN